MTTVIVAEKPSQAKAYAEAFSIKNRTKSYIELDRCSTFPAGAFLTWGIGHLIQLKYPKEYKQPINTWDLNNLPFLPTCFEYKVDSKKYAQYNTVKELCMKADTIINACDVDREGSNIFYLILEHAGIRNKEIKRLWINSLEKEEIKKGFNQLKDNRKDVLMFQEAKARMLSDYLIGMNLSPLYSIKLSKIADFNTIFGVGRVQTPTLSMIYHRQIEIENFKSEPFFEVHADCSKDSQQFTAKMKLKEKDKAVVDKIFEDIKLKDYATVKDIKRTQKQKQAPKLHSLSTLQTKANKLWRYSPKETLAIVQKLYELKLVSYPRTDCQYITEQEFQYLDHNLESYLNMFNISSELIDNRSMRKRFVNNSAVQEHYAIILTKTADVEKVNMLSDKERNIYEEIYNTTIAMFLKEYIYEETDVELIIDDHYFYSRGKVDKQLGWKELFNQKENTESILPEMNIGEMIKAKPFIYEGMTQPPSLYTEGQLINLMKNCGKLLEDEDTEILKEVEGIGTEATRADVIEKLKHHDYITTKKNQVMLTDKGRLLARSVQGTLLSSPEMTAKWEASLKKISSEEQTLDNFIKNTIKYILHQIKQIDSDFKKNQLVDNKGQSVVKIDDPNVIGDCPKCKESVVKKIKGKKGVFYACQNKKCKFVIFKNIFGKNISTTVVKELINHGRTKHKVKGFVSKKGKTYDAFVKLNNHYKVTLFFDNKEG